MIDFPNSPTLGQVFGNYSWDGEKWVQAAATGALPASTLPLVEGAAAIGVSTDYARADHVHPTGGSSTPGTAFPLSPGPAPLVGTSLLYAREDHVHPSDAPLPGTTPPAMDGTSAIGVSTLYARQDHIHPSDTSRAPLDSPVFTGTPTVPTAGPGTNTLQAASTAFVQTAVASSGSTAAAVAPGGRLTFTAATPVMSANVIAGNTIHYVPYETGAVPVYDGAAWSLAGIGAGISQLTTDTTKSPAAVVANSLYDLFVWNDGGTIRLSRGPAWTNATTRALALVRQNGIWVNAAAITNGPLITRGTWVGTFLSDGAAKATWQRGSNAALGGIAILSLWNAYRRVVVKTMVSDSTASWLYGLATFRPANGQTNNRVAFVLGAGDDDIEALYRCNTSTSGNNAVAVVGIGIDSVSVNSATVAYSPTAQSTALSLLGSATAHYVGKLAAGSHFVQALESALGGVSSGFYGGGGFSTNQQMGLTASLMM